MDQIPSSHNYSDDFIHLVCVSRASPGTSDRNFVFVRGLACSRSLWPSSDRWSSPQSLFWYVHALRAPWYHQETRIIEKASHTRGGDQRMFLMSKVWLNYRG